MQKYKQLFKVFCTAALVALSSACSPAPEPLVLSLQWQGQPLRCGQPLHIAGQAFELDTLLFYLSQFSQQQPLRLAESAQSTADLVLLGLDCHDGAGASSLAIPLTAPLHDGPLRFVLGLASEINHQNPLQAPPALQAADMHWSWQFGYKFLRLDLNPYAQASTASPWSFHLGATGCTAPSVMRAPTTPCQAPNTVAVTVDYRTGQQLVLDLAPLFTSLQLTADNSCMSDPQVLSCQQLLGALGLSSAGQTTAVPALFYSAKPLTPMAASPNTGSPNSAQTKGLM